MKYVKATVLGINSIPRRNGQTGEVYENLFVVFQADRPGGLAGQKEEMQVQLTKKQIDGGIAAAYERVKGQEVMVPYFDIPWSGKNGSAGINYFLAGDGKPLGTKAN